MLFTALALTGVFIVDLERRGDSRGYFARTFCRDEFADHGLVGDFVQCSVSRSTYRGTLRGMHYQRAPHAETKLVRCTRGAVRDVVLDLRAEAPTFRRWEAVELSAENGRALYIPAGFAHGFQTLTDDAEVIYQMSHRHHPEYGAGVRWNDPAFAIDWPMCPPILSERDASFADYCRG